MKSKIILSAVCCALCGSLSAASPEDAKVSIAKYSGGRAGAISYTFDDGYSEHYTVAAPELEKRGFRGTFWINGFRINGDTVADTTWASWADLKEMSDRGHEISNHAWAHPNLIRVDAERLRREVQRNDTAIFAATGIFPRTFCYPYNSSNEAVREFASRERVGTRTKQASLGSKATAENLDRRIEKILETGGWDVAMTHGINYGYDAFRSPQVFWDHLDKVKALEDKIWVGTFYEVAAYTGERDNTELDVDARCGKITVTPSCNLDADLFAVPLTMVVEREDLKKVKVRQGRNKPAVKISDGKAVFDFDPFGGPVGIKCR